MLTEHTARLVARAHLTAICLDFDGTLAPIVDDPNEARPRSERLSCSVTWPPGLQRSPCSRVARPITWPSMRQPRECAISGCTGWKRSATGTFG